MTKNKLILVTDLNGEISLEEEETNPKNAKNAISEISGENVQRGIQRANVGSENE